jgi:hypothetical protein
MTKALRMVKRLLQPAKRKVKSATSQVQWPVRGQILNPRPGMAVLEGAEVKMITGDCSTKVKGSLVFYFVQRWSRVF